MGSKISGKFAQHGLTLIELLTALVVLAVLLAIAVPSFSSQIQSGRAQMAADGLKRAASNARSIAVQTGRRTVLTVNGDAASGCDGAAWAITQAQGTDTTVLGCLTQTDFSKRYEGAALSGNALQLTFLPNGIGNNTAAETYTLSSGDTSKSVRVNAGGSVDVL
ncbi:GspH/FimT family protein [Uliginosibacterium sp. H3]|uniref:Type II secretion system protein H n=1 Tax=Uliginosibacterium silvisoli TaxID=3114758 RepID=A0ABU6JZE2_9RHOO|nr:GspH/FimT family protein [Uliginosibacterium sp. H3]